MFVCLYEDCNSRKFVRTAKPFITYPIRGSEPRKQHDISAESLDDHRALEPPDPIPNSVVKRCIADGSVGFPHVRVGHRQAPIPKPPIVKTIGGFTLRTINSEVVLQQSALARARQNTQLIASLKAFAGTYLTTFFAAICRA